MNQKDVESRDASSDATQETSSFSSQGLSDHSLDALDRHIDKGKIKKWSIVKKPRKAVIAQKGLTSKYFTSHKKVNVDKLTDFSKMQSPFKARTTSEQFPQLALAREWHTAYKKEVRKWPVHKKLGEKGRLHEDFFERLYVEDPPAASTKYVIDYDSEFSKIVAGRPFYDSVKIRDYVELTKDVLKTKIIMGYREDDIMLLNQLIANEQVTINRVQRRFQSYLNSFEALLFKDHSTATKFLKDSERLSTELYASKIKLKTLSKKYVSLKAGLIGSYEKWCVYKVYQKFLFHLSPLYWKIENIDQVEDYDVVEISTNDEETMFQFHQPSILMELSADDMMELVRNQSCSKPAPQMYFKDPSEILEIFDYMEVQNLGYLLHAENLVLPLESIQNSMVIASRSFDDHISQLSHLVQELSKSIEWEERRAVDLENLSHSLINNDFKNLIVDEDILNLFVFVEDAFESIVAPNDANFGLMTMMKAIELRYGEELVKFDKLPHEIVVSLEGTCLNEQIKIIKLAEAAARKFEELESVTKQLQRAFAPKYEKGRSKEAKNRSKLIVPRKTKKFGRRPLTQQELDYLEFFTDFCAYSDDPSSYGINRPLIQIVNVPEEPSVEDKIANRKSTLKLPDKESNKIVINS